MTGDFRSATMIEPTIGKKKTHSPDKKIIRSGLSQVKRHQSAYSPGRTL